MNTAAEREKREVMLMEGGGRGALQFYKYTDLLTNTHTVTPFSISQ